MYVRTSSCMSHHQRSFHLAWFGFFISFCSTFMAAPLVSVIRDDLDLTATQVGNANTASITGTVIFRIVMGSLCDSVGPRRCARNREIERAIRSFVPPPSALQCLARSLLARVVAHHRRRVHVYRTKLTDITTVRRRWPRRAYGYLMLFTSIPCYAMTCVTNYAGFVTCRLFIGFSLASFVSTQYWTSSMFTPRIVGGANAITGGWGNLGGASPGRILGCSRTQMGGRYGV